QWCQEQGARQKDRDGDERDERTLTPFQRETERRVDETETEAEPQSSVHREHDRNDRGGSRARQDVLEPPPQPGLPNEDHEWHEKRERPAPVVGIDERRRGPRGWVTEELLDLRE